MDQYQSLTSGEQKQTLDAVSRMRGIAPAIIEKDYWVCRTLDVLFHLPGLSDHLVFKGGTSLSKAYGLIERFSEDVDVSFHRDCLGFGSPDDPESETGSKAQARLIDKLSEACIEKISIEAILHQLRRENYPLREEDVARLSPLGHQHINLLGRYSFTLPEAVVRGGLRALHDPGNGA